MGCYYANVCEKETQESYCFVCSSLEDFVSFNWRGDDADFIGAKLTEAKASIKMDGENMVWEDDECYYTLSPVKDEDCVDEMSRLRVEYEPSQEDFGEFDCLKDWVMQCYYTPEDHEQWLEDYDEDEEYEDSVDYIVDEINYGCQYDEEENASYWNGYKFTLVNTPEGECS